jgi:alkylation response protein AidB-like acyl-CoA dehydrogenase
MNFELTEERQMLQDTLRRFLADKYDTKTRNAILDSASGMSTEIWQEMAELGVLGAMFTEDTGGFGGAGFDIAVVFEELGRAGVVEPIFETCVLSGGLLALLGNDTQKAMIEQIISGETRLALAHSEPRSRYDLNRVETTVQDDTLTGHKSMALGAPSADHIIISAREYGEVGDEDGISLFLIPAQDLTLRSTPLMGGGTASDILLDALPVTDDMRLGAKGGAFTALARTQAAAITALTAQTLGGMETAIRLTTDYLQTRKQFGKPIGTFQTLQHRLADMLIELEQARSAVIGAAGYLEADPKMRDRYASMAKNLMGRAGRLIAEESIQMHGGIAMTQEYELAHIAKRIVMADHMMGDTDHHLERFITLSAS